MKIGHFEQVASKYVSWSKNWNDVEVYQLKWLAKAIESTK